MNKIVLVTALIIGLFSTSEAFNQSPSQRMVTAEDFMGQSTPPAVYDIEVDSEGFVYFVFPGGLWKFNGFSVKKKWEHKKQNDIMVFYAFHKGYHNELLLSGPLGVSYIKEDSIINYPMPDSIVKLGLYNYESVYRDQNGLVHLAPRGHGYFTMDSLGNVVEKVGKSSGKNGFFTTFLTDGHLFNYSIINRESKKPFSLYFANSESKLQFISEINYPIHESSIVQYQNGSYLFSNGNNEVIHFDLNGLIKCHTLEHRVSKLFIDSRDILWVGTADKGFCKFESPDFINPQKFWSGSSAVLAESFDGGLWFKSDSSKFGHIPRQGGLNYSEQNGFPMLKNTSVIDLVHDKIFIQNEKRELFLLDDNNELEKLNPPGTNHISGGFTVQDRISAMTYDKKLKKIWFAYYGQLLSWDGSNWEILKLDTSEFSGFKIRGLMPCQDGRIIGATECELFEIKDGELKIISERSNSKIVHFTIDKFGEIWVGMYNGLWLLNHGKFIRPFENMPDELLTASQFMKTDKEGVWYQPMRDGLVLIKGDSAITVVDQSGEKVRLNNCSVSPSGELWTTQVNSTKKLSRIEYLNHRINIQYYEFDDLAANHGNHGLMINDKEIFIGGKYGVFKQAINELTTKEIPSKAVISEIRINHDLVLLKNTYRLPHHENYINITFDGISFRRIPLTYSYQMKGLDTVWQETEHKQVQYTNLSPGQYNFKLRVKVKNGGWTIPITTSFYIEKPYWQTWWFRIGCILFFLLILGLILRFRIVHVRKKEAEKGRIALELSRLELRALKAQMNPHFIFNTLKSIQNRILKGGKWEANELLVRFSKLIRSSLEYSRSDFISLTEEIDFLRNYLEIEKQRIPNKFDFQIILDSEEGIQDLLVPSLLIQPICENAINYAFEENKGELTINLKLLTEDILEVEVSDNGVGYYNRKKTAHKRYISHGLGIVQSRLDLFKSDNYDTSLRIEPIDKITNKGTRVTLKLPCK